MKKLLTIILILSTVQVFSQEVDIKKFADSTFKLTGIKYPDTLIVDFGDKNNLLWDTDTIPNPICEERGHVQGEGMVMSTLMYNQPYVIDTDSTTVLVQPDSNHYTFRCARCGQLVTVVGRETRTIIWRKEK